DMRRNAFAFARGLAGVGLRRGDCVALVLPEAEDFLTALFGATLAGVLPASLYSPATAADLPRYFELTAGVLRACAARAVVTTGALAHGFEALRGQCPALEVVVARDAVAGTDSASDRVPALDDVALIQFTSGSTSSPKGVVLTHANLCANID